jgi:hypothetical protein
MMSAVVESSIVTWIHLALLAAALLVLRRQYWPH